MGIRMDSKKRIRARRSLLMLVVFALLASGCYTYSVFAPDPKKTLAAEWFAGIPLEKGNVTACDIAFYDGFDDGKGYQCRSIAGVEEAGDSGNWHVDPGGPDSLSNDGIVRVIGTSGSSKGATLVMEDDKTFEGCVWVSPSNTWHCDHMVTLYTVPFDTTKGYDYVAEARKFLDRTVNQLECAVLIAGGVYLGKVWTVGGLYACGATKV